MILAHNYQLPELQDVADFVGDSLGLSRQAAKADADVIEFCGVHFMAETASVLCPDKTVLIADLGAGCSLSESINADQLRAWKAEHPGAVVVMYVNTSAEVKAETDYCCTSGNAVAVVEHILREHGPDTEILFGPDMWLGAFVERETGHQGGPRAPRAVPHLGRRVPRPRRHPPDDIKTVRDEHPNAEFLIHPECGCATQAMEYVASGDIDPDGVQMLSTGGMLNYMEKHPDGEYIVATENGMLYPLQQAAPQAKLIEANRMAFCKYMKMITLPKVRDSLRDFKLRGEGPAGDRRARHAADRAHGRDRLSSTYASFSPSRCNPGMRKAASAPPVRRTRGLRAARARDRARPGRWVGQPRSSAAARPPYRRIPGRRRSSYSTAESPGKDAHQRQFCGGSLLTSRIVITAGHCVADTDPDCGPYGAVPICPHHATPAATARQDRPRRRRRRPRPHAR